MNSNSLQHRKLPPGIIIHNASLNYGNEPLFDNLNLTLLGGQTTCLLGPSGVGKTTLLRMIAGLSENSLHKASQTIIASDGGLLQQRITYMAQQDLLMPWLSVLNNVLISVRLQGKKVSSQLLDRAKHLLSQVGLEEVINQRPASLSGGMRQRAALARTLFENKPIVLMDEPFASLDAITKLQLQDLTAKLLINRTIILVTHDPLEALRLGHRIHVMSGMPVVLDDPLILSGQPPREPGDPKLLSLEAELLKRLHRAHLLTNGVGG